jgi:hypothetical protein
MRWSSRSFFLLACMILASKSPEQSACGKKDIKLLCTFNRLRHHQPIHHDSLLLPISIASGNGLVILG